MATDLVIILGPPAVGKMTVGRELSTLIGFPLYHNHLSIEAVVPVFNFSHPAMGSLVSKYRELMFDQVIESELKGLIFTFVLAFNCSHDIDYLSSLQTKFKQTGGKVIFVELFASLDERVRRNANSDRLAHKPSKRNIEASNRHIQEIDQKYQLNSAGSFPIDGTYFSLDVESLNPKTAGERIAEFMNL